MRQTSRVLHHFGHVDNPGDVGAAIADKDTDTCFLIHRTLTVYSLEHGLHTGSGRLDDGLGDVDRTGGAAAEIDALHLGLERRHERVLLFEKPELVELDLEDLGQPFVSFARQEARGKHQKLAPLLLSVLPVSRSS